QANTISDPEIKKRFYLIKTVVKSPKSVSQVCSQRGVSSDFFYKWELILLKAKNLLSLKSGSRKPKYCPHQTPKRVEKRIKALRLAEPAEGPERISFSLKKLYNMVCSPSGVYAVLWRLGLITDTYKKKLTKTHLKRYRRPLPGWLQMDIKYVPYLINDEQYYEFNIVDHCSTWRCMRIYETKGYESLEKFLKEVEINCPFPIVEVQTDNGKEFTDKYRVGSNGYPTGNHPLDVWRRLKEIRHKLIPIGQKELNGKVENTHKQDDREFYAKYDFTDYWILEKYMRSWNQRWNEQRATKALRWRTPNEVILGACIAWVATLLNYQTRLPKGVSTMIKIDSQGNLFLPIPQDTKLPVLEKPKEKNMVDRYLTWMDGEAKKLKSILVLPPIYQIFSPQISISLEDKRQKTSATRGADNTATCYCFS
ncbi:MAG: integrase core domain-containing protein, partial [Oligoflexia bacterium]|nr:integrase core domain-containing protein [Oligoflexia bacterium]